MTDVELNLKNYKRLLSILSEYFGKKKMSKGDEDLRKKIEVIHDAEAEYEDSFEEEDRFK